MTSLPILRQMLHFDYLFFTYAGSKGDRTAYGPKWFRNLFPSIVPVGLLKRGNDIGYGLMLGTAQSAKDFETPEKIGQMMQTIYYWHQKCKTSSIALGGQLPSLLHRNGVSLQPPVLTGEYGTVYILHSMINALIENSEMDRRQTIVGVVGVGFIGSALVNFLSPGFLQVVALDKREGRPDEQWPENASYTNDPSRICQCDIVVILTGNGDDAAAAISHLKTGAIVIDDAHPQLSPGYARQILDQSGGQVYKAAVGLKDVRFIPRLPGFDAEWIPGCAIEAIVSARFGFDYHTQDEFNELADQMGFYPLFVPHRAEH